MERIGIITTEPFAVAGGGFVITVPAEGNQDVVVNMKELHIFLKESQYKVLEVFVEEDEFVIYVGPKRESEVEDEKF